MTHTMKCIKEVDKRAFNYLNKLTQKEKKRIKFCTSPYVAEMFDWKLTPQGFEFWKKIKHEVLQIKGLKHVTE